MGGQLALWYHIYGYGIISTVPYEQQKIYRQIILFQRIYYLSISLTGLPCHREPSIVLRSMASVSKRNKGTENMGLHTTHDDEERGIDSIYRENHDLTLYLLVGPFGRLLPRFRFENKKGS